MSSQVIFISCFSNGSSFKELQPVATVKTIFWMIIRSKNDVQIMPACCLSEPGATAESGITGNIVTKLLSVMTNNPF